jgi:hypothetical protein
MEVFSIANLCVGFYSWAVLEAAHAGASNLCITPSLEYWREVDHFDENLFKVMLNNVEGGPFQFKGVSTAMGIPEVISTLPGQTLADFELDPQARNAYIKKFLGYADGQSSKRVLATIRTLVDPNSLAD